MPNFSLLELENFKTFREKTTFEWKQISSIYGLNGTGKSTVIEALEFLFCFPKFSGLSVEQFRIEICNNKTQDEDFPRTSVSAVFHLNGEELVFRRTVEYQQLTAAQWINDRPFTLKSYKEALKNYGLHDKSNNFIIHQHEIESIAVQNEQQRCSFFEHLSGSIEYKREYNRLYKQWLEESAKIAKLKSELDFYLSEEKKFDKFSKEADKSDKLKQEFENLNVRIHLIKLWKIQKSIFELEKKQKSDITVLKVTNEKFLDPIEQAMVKLKNQLEEKVQNLSAIYEEANAAESKHSQQSLKLLKLEEKISMCQNDIKKAEKNLQNAKCSFEQHKKIINELKEDYHKLEEVKNDYIQSHKQNFQGTLESGSQFEEYLDLKAQAQEKCIELIRQTASLKRERDSLKDQIDDYERKTKYFMGQITREQSLIEKMNLDKLQIQEKIKDTEEVLSEVLENKNRLIIEAENMTIEAGNLNTEIQRLDAEISVGKIEKTDNRKLKREREIFNLLKANFGEVVYGILSDLCEVSEKKYELALTKIIASKMSFIIVDTEKTAQRCIMFLKNHYAGDSQSAIGTFMPLNAIQERSTELISRYVVKLSYARLAPEIITAELPEIQRLLQYFIGDIVICDTNEQASELSFKKKFKCVSLDGIFYGKDGTVSGGLASLLEKAKQWDEKKIFLLEEERKEIMVNLRKIQLRISKKEEDIKNLNSKVTGLSSRLEKHLLLSLSNLSKQVEQKKEILFNLKTTLANHESKENEIENLQNLFRKKIEEINQYEQKQQEIENEVFSDFCKIFGIIDIRAYEQNDYKSYKEFIDKSNEFDDHLDRIKNQLTLEKSRDTKSVIKKWEDRFNETNQLFRKLVEKKKNLEKKTGAEMKTYNEKKTLEEEIEKLKKEIRLKERELVPVKRDVRDLKKMIASNNSAMNYLRDDMCRLLKECKMKGIAIPMRKGSSESTEQADDTSSNTEEDVEIDFSNLKKKNLSNDEQQNLLQKLTDQMKGLKAKMKQMQQRSWSIKSYKSIEEKRKSAEEKFTQKSKECCGLKKKLDLISKKRAKKFNDFLDAVEENLDLLFKELYHNPCAEAHVHSMNPAEPFSSGIMFTCIIPGKRFLPMSCLSGGEKTMCAVALFFAIHRVKPTLCLIFDEMDSALDVRNLRNLTQFFISLRSTAQIIFITHRECLAESANACIGINLCPITNSSRVIHVDLDKCLKALDTGDVFKSKVDAIKTMVRRALERAGMNYDPNASNE